MALERDYQIGFRRSCPSSCPNLGWSNRAIINAFELLNVPGIVDGSDRYVSVGEDVIKKMEEGVLSDPSYFNGKSYIIDHDQWVMLERRVMLWLEGVDKEPTTPEDRLRSSKFLYHQNKWFRMSASLTSDVRHIEHICYDISWRNAPKD